MGLASTYLRMKSEVEVYKIECDQDPLDSFDPEVYAEDPEFCAFVQRVEEYRKRGEVSWEWCDVRVEVTFNGVFEGEAFLGSCSFANFQDFKEGGYYEDLLDEAFGDLERTLTFRVFTFLLNN